MNADLQTDRSIERKLRHTWGFFFARHGRLRDVQRAAIPVLLKGQNALVCSPTASGKTEAVVVPLVERLLTRGGKWTLLYIIPTRALVNDLYERLYRPLSDMGVVLARRTGEHRVSLDKDVNVLLTTPESLDSLLCRARKNNGHYLQHVSAVVVDEIHLLADSPRGEQVRWLLERLKRLRAFAKESGWIHDSTIQLVGLSASVRQPHVVKEQFFGTEAALIESAGQRKIEHVGDPHAAERTEDWLPGYLAQAARPLKVLIFANSRVRVDALAEVMPNLVPSDFVCFGHHGSLSKSIREEVEERFKIESNVVMMSTSTLEIGIDIGDIDLVVLDSPPSDIGALLQRIGRGNRRTDTTKIMTCSLKEHEPLVHRSMLLCAEKGDFGGEWKGLQLSTALQQILSFIYQRGRRSTDAVEMFVRSMLPETLAGGLVDNLVSNGMLRDHGGAVTLGELAQDFAESGRIHSVIESNDGLSIRDEKTGKVIAKGISAHKETISIAGAKMNVTAKKGKFVDVTRGTMTSAEKVSYQSSPPAPQMAQAYAIRRYLNLESTSWPILNSPDETVVFHLGGTQVRALLWLLFEIYDEGGLGKCNDFFLVSGPLQKPAWISSVQNGRVLLGVEKHVERLEKLLSRPKANLYLPSSHRVQEVLTWLNFETTMDVIRAARWEPVKGIDHRNELSALTKVR
ncbi:MAG: DEAD/DEAH box helicase [Candidatus Obscuribacterales bacterium]|nr:DEAD/DEAH box helicase [Candidatus Obscuribacterales bacterium]